jgi:hypothetical protein
LKLSDEQGRHDSTVPASADRKPTKAEKRLQLVESFADIAIASGLLSAPKGDGSKVAALRRLVVGVAGSDGETLERRPANRIAVDLDARTVSLDGIVFDVTSVQALRWVDVLSRQPGCWISSRDLRLLNDELTGARTDKLRKFLPEEIGILIESKAGFGSRFRLPDKAAERPQEFRGN